MDEVVDLQETLEVGAEILEIHVKKIPVKNYQFDIKYLEIGNFWFCKKSRYKAGIRSWYYRIAKLILFQRYGNAKRGIWYEIMVMIG